MTIVTLHGRRALVSRPDGSERGRLGVDIVATLARARREGTSACLLVPDAAADDGLLALTTDEVVLVHANGIHGVWARTCWRTSQWLERRRMRAADARAVFWREWYREIRRQISDERLPIDLRGRLRDASNRAYARAQQGSTPPPFPRTWLRERVHVRLPDALERDARHAADAAGLDVDRPFVLIDVRGRRDSLTRALDRLAAHGYAAITPAQSPLLNTYLQLRCAFVVCDTSEAQRAAYLTNTPTLTINASDPFTFYPVRADGVYLLKTAIDLDSGRTLDRRELLTEAYYRNQRNCGFRDNSAGEIDGAVAEMVDGLRDGWRESAGQARYRADVVEAGSALAARVRHVAKWGPVDGFIGDGRLARIAAER